jgi:hypothetical protein
LLAGVALGGSVSHAFVTFDQKTIWDLDKPLTGKVENQRIVWRQSSAVAKDNADSFAGVTNSFNKWENVANSRLAFTNGGASTLTTNSSQDGQNVIAWSVNPSNDFSANTLAICFSSFTVGTTSSFLDGDIIFNDKSFNWSAGGSGNVDSVSLHEIGHMIGLGHTTDKGTVMFPFDSGLLNLTSDEIAAAQALYPGTDGAPKPTGGPIASAAGSAARPAACRPCRSVSPAAERRVPAPVRSSASAGTLAMARPIPRRTRPIPTPRRDLTSRR